MLYVEPEDIEVVPADRRALCSQGCGRQASWKLELTAGGFGEFCGWCTLYSGKTRWGQENSEELAHVGEVTLAASMKSLSKSVTPPELDVHHRMDPASSERQVMAIIFTSRMLKNGPLGRMIRRRAEVEADDVDS